MADKTDRTKPSSKKSDATVYSKNQSTVPAGDTDGTVYAATQYADTGYQNTKLLKEAERNVSLDWNVGDVILNIYEVLPVDGIGTLCHEGGFGKVYKVHHKTWGIDLAVKTPHAGAFVTEAQKQDFINECQAWIELGLHPNIASCYYVRELGGVPRIFAEYVDGGSLKEWIKRGQLYEGGKEASLKRIFDIAIQFAWGLHYAHEKGMIHQDVKPHNVMLTKAGEAKVVDFGLARAKAAGGMLDCDKQQSVMLTSAGGYTPAYCSPEQISGSKLTRRTDIWSWGLSVLEMYAGDATWMSGAIAAFALESFLENNESTSDIPSMPEGVALVLKQCFAEKVDNRPQTMIEVAYRMIEIYRRECKEEYPSVWEKGASDTPDALNNYALSYIDLGYHSKAEKTWEKALAVNSQHLLSVYNRGLLLWRTGRITDLELVAQIKNINVTKPDIWLSNYLLGMIHIERSDAASAINVLEKAAELNGDNLDIIDALKSGTKSKNKWCHHIKSIKVKYLPKTVISKDGKYLLTGGHSDTSLHMWETSSGQYVRAFESHKGGINALSISDNGRYVISGCSEGIVKIWDFPSGRCIHTLYHSSRGTDVWVCAVTISSDGGYAISGGTDNLLKCWHLPTGKIRHSLSGHNGFISSVAMSSDIKYAVSGSSDGTIKLWDVDAGLCINTFIKHEYGVSCVAMTKDIRYILSGGSDRTLKLWDVTTGKCLRTFISHRYTVSALALSSDDKYVLSGETQIQYNDNNMLKMFDISTGKCLRTFGDNKKYKVDDLTTADGSYVVTSNISDGAIDLWRTDISNIFAKWYLSRPERVSEITQIEKQLKRLIHESEQMKAQGKYIEAGKLLLQAQSLPGGQRFNELHDAWASIYRFLPKFSFKNAWEIESLENYPKIVFSLKEREDGSYIMSEKNDQTQDILNIVTTSLNRNLIINQSRSTLLFIDSTGEYAISKFSKDSLKLWEISSGKCRYTFKGEKGEISVVKISPYERYLLVGAQPYNAKTCALKLWELSTGKCLRTFKISSFGHAVALSIDGKYMIAGNLKGPTLFGNCDSPITYWDVSSGNCLKTFTGHNNYVAAIDVSADGRFFISGSSDKTIKYWDIQTGKCLQTFTGHTDGILSAVLSADNRYVLSGGHDKLVKLWEVKTGKCLHTFEGHKKSIYSVALSADSRYAISKSVDDEVKLWEITWNVQAVEQVDWHDGAEPYLRNFLMLHKPYNTGKLKIRKGCEWTDKDFEQLMIELGYRGYGYLMPEGVRVKLEELKESL